MQIKTEARKIGISVLAGFAMTVLPLAAFARGSSSVPEPDTMLLIGLGAAAIWVARYLKK